MFKSCFDLASVALFDLLVSARERRAACDVAEDQDHDVDAEEGVGHGCSIPRDVAVDQVQADQQHSGCEEDGDANEFVEGHGLPLAAREHVNDAVCSHTEADKAQDEDEEGHGGSVLEKKGAKSPEEAAYCEEAHEAQGEEGGGGHSSLDLVRLEQLGRHAALLPHERGNDAITDSVRENVRPLVYRLVGNAERLSGGGSGASEVFNGF